MTSRRAFFRAILAIPFAPKCIHAVSIMPGETPLNAAIAKAAADMKAVMGIYECEPMALFDSSMSGVAIEAKRRRVAALHSEGGTLRVTWEDGGLDTLDGRGAAV